MLLTSIIHFAFATEKEVKSKIKNVTVFLTGAEINRSANVSLSSGNQIIVLKDLSQYIDANTIQVSGIGNFIILGVDYRRNYINTSKNTEGYISVDCGRNRLATTDSNGQWRRYRVSIRKNERNLKDDFCTAIRKNPLLFN